MVSDSKNIITTAASNNFFPFLLNLIGSIHKNYKNPPKIMVFDIGLHPVFKQHLKLIKGIEVIEIPKFATFWNSCYSWKIWMYHSHYGGNQLHIDAGSSVLAPLDSIFSTIQKKGYFTITQKSTLKIIVPKEYYNIFGLSHEFDDQEYFTAGILGINKKNDIVKKAIHVANSAMLSGMCLGFSESEQNRNKGKNKSQFVRNCPLFRHDQTVLNIVFHKYIENLQLQDIAKYAYIGENPPSSECLIHNHRRDVRHLKYIQNVEYKNKNMYFYVSMIVVNVLILMYKTLKLITILKKKIGNSQ